MVIILIYCQIEACDDAVLVKLCQLEKRQIEAIMVICKPSKMKGMCCFCFYKHHKGNTMKKYPIGFWNYVDTNAQGPNDVKDWVDLGMTIAMSPGYNHEIHDKNALIEILDACEDSGIKVIVVDSRGHRWGGASTNPNEYEKLFKEAYEDFGKHPAVIGFHIGDEPGTERVVDDCNAAYRTQLKVAPQLTPFINYCPYPHPFWRENRNETAFSDWAQNVIEQGGLKIICYDCYSQMRKSSYTDGGVEEYFTNLRLFTDAAERAGISPWTTLLSVGHFHYRCPNVDEFRWQLNTAVASGMKGILWFFVYERGQEANYRLAPIDAFGDRTETFTGLSRVNRSFLHQFGDFFLEAEHKATYHTGKQYGGYPLFVSGETSDIILDVDEEYVGLPAIVSFFEKDGEKFVVIVNNSMEESGCFRLHLSKDIKALQRLHWDGDFKDVEIHTKPDLIYSEWHAPGQMNVYKYK